jgi:hypothetical protein
VEVKEKVRLSLPLSRYYAMKKNPLLNYKHHAMEVYGVVDI